MKGKIFIGITTSKREVSVNFASKQSVTYIQEAFLDFLKSYDNVIPIVLADTDPEHASDIVATLDGLILSSGEDVDPSFFNAVNLVKYDDKLTSIGCAYHRPHLFAPNKKRDLFELSLYKAAKEKNIPILGVCRGMQLINIAEGGTLHQETPQTHINHFLDKDGWIHFHGISLEKDTKLFEIFEKESYSVSSIHHQSIDKLGEGLIVSAFSEDDVVEVIEHKDKEFIMGFQGHIEKITDNFPLYNKVIQAFIEKAKTRSLSL